MALVKLTVIERNKVALTNHTPQGFICDYMGAMHVSNNGLYTEFTYMTPGQPIPVYYAVNQTIAQIQQLCCCVADSQVGSGV